MVNGTTLNQVYEELKKIEANMVTKEDISMLLETVEILSNENTIKQIKQSEDDIKQNKVKKIKSISDI